MSDGQEKTVTPEDASSGDGVLKEAVLKAPDANIDYEPGVEMTIEAPSQDQDSTGVRT